MISGMGIPSSMLQYSDELEFARSVSMQNGMFLRSVIVKQKKLTPPFTSMYQDLYENEFGDSTVQVFNKKELKKQKEAYKNFLTDSNGNEVADIDETNTERDKSVDIKLIKVQFPSPSSLNATNLADQISNAQNIVQAIVDSQFNSNGEVDETHKYIFTKELNKKYIPNVDWDEIDDLFKSTQIQAMEAKVEAEMKKETDGSSSDDSAGF